ncbi:MAG: DUF2249 domain-containing protein [Thermoanaerobaculia bacterium]
MSVTATREVDVRNLAPEQRRNQIFQKFRALAPGEAFVVVNDHDPRPFVGQLQKEHTGTFEWNVLERGPERFRVELRRRTEGGARNVSEFLGGDHRRLDVILSAVEGLVEKRDFAQAARRFAEFACGLSRHIEMEEGILFPAFEAKTGMTAGPTAVMRHEHAEIRGLLEILAAALAVSDAHAFSAADGQLHKVLGAHNQKEEQILYPMSDRVAGGERERDDLVRKMQAV